MNESRLGYILQGGYILGGVDPYMALEATNMNILSLILFYMISSVKIHHISNGEVNWL